MSTFPLLQNGGSAIQEWDFSPIRPKPRTMSESLREIMNVPSMENIAREQLLQGYKATAATCAPGQKPYYDNGSWVCGGSANFAGPISFPPKKASPAISGPGLIGPLVRPASAIPSAANQRSGFLTPYHLIVGLAGGVLILQWMKSWSR